MLTADDDDDDAAFFTRKNKIFAHKDVGLFEQYMHSLHKIMKPTAF
jgi:hypothetical protein